MATRAFLVGVAAIPLQWFPPMPLAGMAVSDVFFLASFVLAIGAARMPPVPRVAIAAGGVFAGAALASAASNGTGYAKTIGHCELVAIAGLAALWGDDGRVQRALLVASLFGALTGVVGAAAYYAGLETALLNPTYGNLAPGDYPRVRGTAVRANQLASIVSIGMVVLWTKPRLIPHRYLRAGAFGVMGLALLFTFSRTLVFTGLALGAVTLVRRRARVAWLPWGLATLAGLVGLWLTTRYALELDPLDPWTASLTDRSGARWIHAVHAWQTATTHPWLGVGPTTEPSLGSSAHFTWINIWALLGLPAALAFSTLYANALLRARRDLALLACLGLLLSDSLHRDIEDMRHVWVVLGLCLAKGSRGEEATNRPDGMWVY